MKYEDSFLLSVVGGDDDDDVAVVAYVNEREWRCHKKRDWPSIVVRQKEITHAATNTYARAYTTA